MNQLEMNQFQHIFQFSQTDLSKIEDFFYDFYVNLQGSAALIVFRKLHNKYMSTIEIK